MGRSPCCDKNGLKKGPWTPEEDKKLIDHIQKNGHGSWRTLPKNAGLQRCGKSCRLRWANYLRPDIKRGKFSLEEEETIIQLHSVLGNKWSTIAARLPGRTDNEIKNYWNTHIKKKLLKMGIDPVTHTPRLDLFDLSAMFRSSFINQSHQLTNISRLLALQSLVNPNLTKLLTTLVSSRLEKLEHLPQNMQENNPFSNFQPNQMQETSFPTPYVKIENNQTIPQFPCNVHQESNLNTMNFNSQEKFFQENAILPSNMMENLGQELNQEHGWSNTDKFFMNPLLENSNFQASDYTNKNFDFDSIISTPSSSQTPLNSSTNITSSIEDDRDSYCSDLLKFEFSDLLDLNGFM